jgi:hypothetical protein
MSAFALEDDIVYRTFSTYSRGVDPLFGGDAETDSWSTIASSAR